MEMHYRKSDNKLLFSNFKDATLLNVEKPQNYIPLYSTFFKLNETNCNNINLDQKELLIELTEKITENKFIANIKNTNENNIQKKPIFFKLSPLLDPIKFLIGKYGTNANLLTLPTLDIKECHPKFSDHNNASYIDSFFTYLTSMLLHEYKFTHGIDFYGSYLAIKKDYKYNIFEDIEYLQDSEYFKSNNGKDVNNITFSLDNEYISDIIGRGSKFNKEKITLDNSSENGDCTLTLSDISDLQSLDSIFSKNEDEAGNINLLYEGKNTSENSVKTSSTCSSRSSDTNSDSSRESDTESDDDEVDDSNSDDESGTSCGSSSGSSSGGSDSSSGSSTDSHDEELYINISQFPIQLIALEQCDHTLDSFLTKNDLSDEEWDSLVLQVIMTLITYQKVFDLTHNDLHTNNIMYNKTDKKYLYYQLNGKKYRVPTYGKIYKIIDFGRAIYKFRGKVICSDSFHPDGDAATQYNCLPYLNEKKPVLMPNPSFDLCRLGCSLFDFIVDELEENEEIEELKDIDNINSTIKKIVLDWCKDDKNRNIIYKKNGDERYPEFKLYKMIARTVHNHIPTKVLENPYFNKYIIQFVSKKDHIQNIDEYPIFTN